jgi:hypothetical protein
MMMCRLDNTLFAVADNGSDRLQYFIVNLIQGNLENFPRRIKLAGRIASIEEDPADHFCGMMVGHGDTKIAVLVTNTRFPDFEPCALARQALRWALGMR